MKACNNATSNSNTPIKRDIGTDSPAHAALPNVKIIPVRDNTIICPAVMFANKRTVKANGFVKTPIISIGIIMNKSNLGTPGILKMWPQ